MAKLRYQNLVRLTLAALLALSLATNIFISHKDLSEDLQFISEPQSNYIFRQLVFISGEIQKPGVYEVSQDTRVSELIDIAGGLTANADTHKVSNEFNLAKKLKDEERIYIPSKATSSHPITSKSLTSINIANKTELEMLPGVGPVTATNIINNRPYKTLDQLIETKVLTQKKFDDLKEYIRL